MELEELGRVAPANPAPDWNTARELDPDYTALNGEIARMSSVTESAAAPPEWELVVNKAAAILAGKIKDIQVAGYGAVGMLHQSGIRGLSAGLEILADIFSLHSDAAFPPKKRQRARLNAVQWWLEQAVAWLGGQEILPLEADQHERLIHNADRLQEALDSNFGDDAPHLRELKQHLLRIPVIPRPPEAEERVEAEEIAVEALPVAVPAPESKGAGNAGSAPVPAAAPAAAAPQTLSGTVPANVKNAASAASAAGTAGAAVVPANAADARRLVLSLLGQAADAAESIAAADPANPLPYRLRRLAAWSGVIAPPPAEEGRTLLPPPESHVSSTLEALLAAGDYAGALRAAEERVGAYLFWLDLQRVAAEALAALGGPYQAALKAVNLEAAAYLERLPSLPRLAFADGTPFANAKTRAWLDSLQEDKRGGGSGGAALNPAVTEALAKAKSAAAANPEEAFQTLGAALGLAGHPREQLALRLEIMRTFAAAGRSEAAKELIPPLLEILDRHGLEVWDAPLAGQALAAMLGVLGEGEADAAVRAGLRRRLAWADPARCLRAE